MNEKLSFPKLYFKLSKSVYILKMHLLYTVHLEKFEMYTHALFCDSLL